MSKESQSDRVVGLLTEIRDLLAQGQPPVPSPAEDSTTQVTGD